MFIMAKMIVPLIKAGAPVSSNRKLKKKKSSQNTPISPGLAAKGEWRKKCKEESKTMYLEQGQKKSS